MKKTKPGFTLIELLVVIAIIGLLSTLSIVALNSARAKSRDARRVSDIKQTQTALELFFNEAGYYPTAASTTMGGGKISSTSTVYMQIICRLLQLRQLQWMVIALVLIIPILMRKPAQLALPTRLFIV